MCFVVFIVFYVYKHAKAIVLVCGSDWSTCGFHDAVGEYVAFLSCRVVVLFRCVYRKLFCMGSSALVNTVYLVLCMWLYWKFSHLPALNCAQGTP